MGSSTKLVPVSNSSFKLDMNKSPSFIFRAFWRCYSIIIQRLGGIFKIPKKAFSPEAMKKQHAKFSQDSPNRCWVQKQRRSSSTPVTSDLAKTFRQKCLWLHQLVKNQKSTEGSAISVLGNPQRDVGDWLPLINKPDTIATYSIPTATCQQKLTIPSNACPHVGQKCCHTEQKK